MVMAKINYNINGNGIATEKKICEQMQARMIFHILKFNFEIHFFEIEIDIVIDFCHCHCYFNL